MKVPASIEAASRFMGPRQGRVYACPSVLAFALFMILVVPTPKAFAARLGGAYYVDDAEIGKPGSCEIESWSSFAANGDRIAVFSPACVLNLGRPVELGTNIVNLRSDAQGDTIATLTAKTVPIPIGPSGFGLAIAGAIIYDPGHQTGNGVHRQCPGVVRFQQEPPGQCKFRRSIQRWRPARVVRYGRRRGFLEFRSSMERDFGGVRNNGTRPIQSARPERTTLQPYQRYRLGPDLRAQSNRRRGKLDNSGAYDQDW